MIALGTPEKALSSSGFEFLQNQEKQVESGLLNDYQSVTGVPQHAHNIPQEKLGDLQFLRKSLSNHWLLTSLTEQRH